MKLYPVPLTLAQANAHVAAFHRHNKPVTGHRFSVGAALCDDLVGEVLVGVAIVGRPVARALDPNTVAEVTRCCVANYAPKGTCSFLYAVARRTWFGLGGHKIITYTLQSESGASMRGAGWTPAAELGGRDTSGWQTRPGRAQQSVVGEAKIRWESVNGAVT